VAAPVKLREGSNTIIIRASEPDGTVRQEIRTVVYERPTAVPAAGPVLAAKPNREQWAVVIGVGAYKSTAIPQLRYSVADAELVHQVLVGQGGFKKENVLLITDKTERKPTLRDLKWALGTFLARSAKKDDLILIFFAGHGAPEIDPRGAESDGLAKYLVPSDADPNDLYSTALPMDEFQTIFDRIEGRPHQAIDITSRRIESLTEEQSRLMAESIIEQAKRRAAARTTGTDSVQSSVST
jgi:hypothetical protein